MAVSAWVAERRFELGAGSFLKAWFSTIFVRLEGESWGSVYPTILATALRQATTSRCDVVLS